MTPGQLVDVVAEVFKIPESEVTAADLRLVQAGLRTTGGRGRSSAHVDGADVAHLVLGALLARRPADVLATVKEFSNLSCVSDYLNAEQRPLLPSRTREAAVNRKPFGKVFAALVEDVAAGEMDSEEGLFYLKLSPQNKRAEIGFTADYSADGVRCELAFWKGNDPSEPWPYIDTTHTINLSALLRITEKMRGAR